MKPSNFRFRYLACLILASATISSGQQNFISLPAGWSFQCKTSQSLLISLPDAKLLISPVLFEADPTDPAGCMQKIADDIYCSRQPRLIGTAEMLDSCSYAANFTIACDDVDPREFENLRVILFMDSTMQIVLAGMTQKRDITYLEKSMNFFLQNVITNWHKTPALVSESRGSFSYKDEGTGNEPVNRNNANAYPESKKQQAFGTSIEFPEFPEWSWDDYLKTLFEDAAYPDEKVQQQAVNAVEFRKK